MTRRQLVVIVAAVIGVALPACAFAIAPRSCEGGLEMYVGAGLFACALLAALPFAMRDGDSLAARGAWAAGLLLLGVAAWLAGLFAANVRIMCRLF